MRLVPYFIRACYTFPLSCILFQLKAKGDSKKGALNQEKSDEEKGPLLPYDVPEGEGQGGVNIMRTIG